MGDRVDKHLAVTLSGVRYAEGSATVDVIAACGLHTEDITAKTLRNTIVARIGPQIIGTVALEVAGSFGLLRSLAVLETYRGQGVGRQLLTAAEKLARQQGLSTLYLLTMTADRFFAANGFETVDRSTAPAGIQETAEFKQLCPDSAICMKKTIA